MTPWQEAELHFWREWLPANRPRYGEVFHRYDSLRPFVDTSGVLLDIGCGPFPYSKAWPDAQHYLVDPLIEEYTQIEGTSIRPTDFRCRYIYDVPPLAYVSTAFVLNCLDHMTPGERLQISAGLQRLRPKRVLIHVTLRRPDQVEKIHPFPFVTDMLADFVGSQWDCVLDQIGESDDMYNWEPLPALQRVYRLW